MLHKDPFIIDPKTFTLIQELQAIEEFSAFNLVGGTALALMLGHRNSIDIDLFCANVFDDSIVMEVINERYAVQEIFRRKNTIICLINNIKTDFIRHDYPLLNPPIEQEGIRYLSKEDIAAMKFHAIIQSGKRLKDFIDIYFLLEHLTMGQMIEFFSQKYGYMNPMMALKAVNYFEDIDENLDPPKLIEPLKLAKIKQRIQEAVVHTNKLF
jgi:hypothetical protein